MMILSHLLTIPALAGLALATAGKGCLRACKLVEGNITSASGVYYSGDPLYIKGESHYFASSQQAPACVVEPGTPEDVGKILRVIGDTKTPFAVKSGGHASNPGFSSTKGIQIYTGRFSQVTYDPTSGTAKIGTGLVWDVVYERLREFGVIVVGGRVTGIGVGGFALGGGYSYLTNQHGPCIDTIVGYDLVLPDGTVTYVTESTQPDLFWGLKGGFNNFGIVTAITMTTFPQTDVWGGFAVYPSSSFGQVSTAIADFSVYSQDPKAVILPVYGNESILQFFFYDGPSPPPGTFDNFTSIPFNSRDLKIRPYLDMIVSANANTSSGFRGTYQMIGVTHFTPTLLGAIQSEATSWAAKLTPKGGVAFSYTPEPFLQSYLSHADSSAWPDPSARKPGKAPNPLVIYFGWKDARYDDVFIAGAEESAKHLATVAKAEGLFLDDPKGLYGNYVDANTPLVDIYGSNLPRLRALKKNVDPRNVMGLAGGFKF